MLREHALQNVGQVRQFLLLLRGIIGVNRAAIFLRPHLPSFGGVPAALEALTALLGLRSAPLRPALRKALSVLEEDAHGE